ncbi:hypothetical protein [Spirosoma sp. KNUC1025]|uniref:hypothetical protein n=1 Tax=Spirosoma sp. KNUC1025 TaxID=2894082 RepID=UPI00386BC46A
MNIAFYSAHSFEQPWFDTYSSHSITYIPKALTIKTAILAKGHHAVCAFSNDDLSRPVLQVLKKWAYPL